MVCLYWNGKPDLPPPCWHWVVMVAFPLSLDTDNILSLNEKSL